MPRHRTPCHVITRKYVRAALADIVVTDVCEELGEEALLDVVLVVHILEVPLLILVLLIEILPADQQTSDGCDAMRCDVSG